MIGSPAEPKGTPIPSCIKMNKNGGPCEKFESEGKGFTLPLFPLCIGLCIGAVTEGNNTSNPPFILFTVFSFQNNFRNKTGTHAFWENGVHYPRVFPGAHPLTKNPEDSGPKL